MASAALRGVAFHPLKLLGITGGLAISADGILETHASRRFWYGPDAPQGPAFQKLLYMRRPSLLEYLLPINIELGSVVMHHGRTASIQQKRRDFYAAYVDACKEWEDEAPRMLSLMISSALI